MSNLQELLKGAQEDGLIGTAALATMNIVDMGVRIQDSLGIDASLIDSSEVFGLFAVVDDSSSIETAGNTPVVRDGYNSVLDALMASQTRDDILVSTMLLNGGMIQPPVALANAQRLGMDYRPSGTTPLYDRTIEMCMLAAAKYKEISQTGSIFRGVIWLTSDGADVGSRASPQHVRPWIEKMRQFEVFQVLALGIEDGHTDFKAVFEAMGVLPDSILTVKNDPSSIRKAFGVVSRASASASQGGSVSRSGGLAGFAG
jgi:hypothetical protein